MNKLTRERDSYLFRSLAIDANDNEKAAIWLINVSLAQGLWLLDGRFSLWLLNEISYKIIR